MKLHRFIPLTTTASLAIVTSLAVSSCSLFSSPQSPTYEPKAAQKSEVVPSKKPVADKLAPVQPAPVQPARVQTTLVQPARVQPTPVQAEASPPEPTGIVNPCRTPDCNDGSRGGISDVGKKLDPRPGSGSLTDPNPKTNKLNPRNW